MTVATFALGRQPSMLWSMGEPQLISNGLYLYLGYTIQRRDRPVYEDRWFVFEDVPPGRTFVKHSDGSLITFGSPADAAGWIRENIADGSTAV